MANALHLGLQPGGNALHLGYTGANNRELVVAARTAPPIAALRLARITRCQLAARTAAPRAILRAAYDPNLLSGVVGATADRWSPGLGLRHAAPGRFSPAARLAHPARAQWSRADALREPLCEQWRDAPGASGGGPADWRAALHTDHAEGAAWADAPRLDHAGDDAWTDGLPQPGWSDETWMRGLPRPIRETEPAWTDAGRKLADLRDPFGDGLRLEDPCDRNSWQDADWVGYVRRKPVPWTPPPKPWAPYGNALHLCRFEGGNALHLGYQCERRIPRRRSYRVQHLISIIRLSDGLPVPCSNITLSLDADAWAWSWSATLLGAEALASVLPTELGEPVTLAATINAHTWHLVVEDWQEDRSFGSRSIKVSGRGLSAWLGQPYEPGASDTLANARYLSQAMEDLLPLGSGWALEWADGTPDWLLPAGSWSWQGQAPIQAIHAAAQGSGLVVVPDMAAQTITIQQRYPVLPWQYADATPDLTIPDSALLSIGRRQAVPSQANAIYVYGGSSGIIARCWRTGTAGDKAATAVQSDWITHVDGARLLGSRLLAAQEQQPVVRTATLPLGGVFLLAQLGELVSLDLGGEDVRGIVNGVSITAQAGTVRQTITLGEDTPNVWALWRRLLPEAPLLLGEVAAIHEDGTRTVDLAGGGRLRARGEGNVGTNVWVRSGRIEGPAPDLPSYDIEVF